MGQRSKFTALNAAESKYADQEGCPCGMGVEHRWLAFNGTKDKEVSDGREMGKSRHSEQKTTRR
jgi:hypothetical protein